MVSSNKTYPRGPVLREVVVLEITPVSVVSVWPRVSTLYEASCSCCGFGIRQWQGWGREEYVIPWETGLEQVQLMILGR